MSNSEPKNRYGQRDAENRRERWRLRGRMIEGRQALGRFQVISEEVVNLAAGLPREDRIEAIEQVAAGRIRIEMILKMFVGGVEGVDEF